MTDRLTQHERDHKIGLAADAVAGLSHDELDRFLRMLGETACVDLTDRIDARRRRGDLDEIAEEVAVEPQRRDG